MADPVSWMMIAATAMSATSKLVEGVQSYQQGRYEADVAGQNANIAKENAARARLDSDRAEEAQRRQLRKDMGRAWAASSQSGAAGSGPGAGSFGAINSQSAKEGELDALNIRYAGDTERHASLVQEAQFRSERKAAIQRARGGLLSGVMGAASTALSGRADYNRSRTTPSTAGGRSTKYRSTTVRGAPAITKGGR